VDTDFLNAPPAIQEYVALHELFHASQWNQFVTDAGGDVRAAMEQQHRLSIAFDEIAYHQNELNIEAQVRAILLRKYGGADKIPSEVEEVMRRKQLAEQRELNRLRNP
jgi:hypothetical protein